MEMIEQIFFFVSKCEIYVWESASECVYIQSFDESWFECFV